MSKSSSSVQVLNPTSAISFDSMATPVGTLRNTSHAQQHSQPSQQAQSSQAQKNQENKTQTIVATLSDTSDSEQEVIGSGGESEPEEDVNPEEARETLQHENLIKAGYLKKIERRKSSKRRWFVLRSTKLAYYKNLNDIGTVAEVKLKNKTNVFCIVTPKRTYYVRADSSLQIKTILSEKPISLDESTTRSPVVEFNTMESHNSVIISSSLPSSPVTGQFVPERKDSVEPTTSSEEEEGVEFMDDDDENDRIIQNGYVYKLDRFKKPRPHLVINLSDILDAIEMDPLSKSKQHCFKIITPKRNYICCAMDAKSQVTWLAALQGLLKLTSVDQSKPVNQKPKFPL
ncbi:6628_t:CDS:10 [Diversispora eburnea]|uniref:6628_t:CDS:1 n=1 Tax=Diversispora eburnea TaxID=1213867 RepID=A0A9N9FEX1_9GLOM|nr:6628_t:CDS:10 [Diversispora eburnea]